MTSYYQDKSLYTGTDKPVPGLSASTENTIHLLSPLCPHDALKHHFTSLKTDLIFLQPKGLGMNISMKLVYQYNMAISLLFHPHKIIFIHYKSRIATAIRGL